VKTQLDPRENDTNGTPSIVIGSRNVHTALRKSGEATWKAILKSSTGENSKKKTKNEQSMKTTKTN